MLIHYKKHWMILVFLCAITCKDVEEVENNPMKDMRPMNSPVEVTAVLINCELDDIQKHPDNEDTRFEREELFKHNALRNCDKKLTLTIKLTSASAKSADEYVPIDHVVDSSGKGRVRLLNPYVLRLRRDAPHEAYKLRFIETVRGILATRNEQNHKYNGDLWKTTADTEEANTAYNWHIDTVGPAEPLRAGDTNQLTSAPISAESSPSSSQIRGHERRFIRMVENAENSGGKRCFSMVRPQKPHLVPFQSQHANCSSRNVPKICPVQRTENDEIIYSKKRAKRHEKNVIIEEETSFNKRQENKDYPLESRFSKVTINNGEINKNKVTRVRSEINDKRNGNVRPQDTTGLEKNENIDVSGKEFNLYELENPMLWFGVHIHLFEKLSTLEGNTLWNDITKGVPISLSTLSPEWSGPDLSVHYKPFDTPKEDFTLPRSSLCLLIPLLEEHINRISSNTNDNPNYILLPSEDVLDIEKTVNSNSATNISSEDTNESHRKVVVRVARALNNIKGDKLNIINLASDKFLTIRHQGTRHAQVDLEARADDNQLVHVSAPGRIAIIVTDNTRASRSTLTVQATNTGLFASRFRVQLRECDSDLIMLSKKQNEGVNSEAVVLPPRHTRRFRLRLPGALSVDLQHCSVYLLNGNGDSVAVRDAVIKKGDQCFCVWHCDCVCYGDSPRLPCREMSPARQDAAGLPQPPQRGARYARACHYSDVTSVNLAVVVIGVIAILLFFGVLKGVMGLMWTPAGVWGLDWVLEEPRQLDRYHECALQSRAVVYDDQGWPVHPDTGKRTVRVVSLAVEFVLNVVFFVVAPGLVIVDTLKHLTKRKNTPTSDTAKKCKQSKASQRKSSKTKFNSRHDFQGRKLGRSARCRPRLPHYPWMTANAADLSSTLWATDSTTLLFPLLPDMHPEPQLGPAQSSSSDSELEDTAFVLMHMQKSTESLARNQMQSNAAGISTDTDHTAHKQQTGKGKTADLA